MKRLPLYESKPVAAAEVEPPLDPDSECTRCALSHGVVTPCMGAEGEPGGLLVIGDYPLIQDDRAKRPFTGPAGTLLREAIGVHWQGPVAYTHALRCSPGTRKLTDKYVTQCRGYLAGILKEVAPTRVLIVGTLAAHALLGRGVSVHSARGGHTHLFGGDAPVPVYYTISPLAASRNRFLRDLFTRDVEAALRGPAPALPPLDGELRIVETEADAHQAVAELRAARWGSFDVETAGAMHDPSFRLLCLSASPAGADYAWVWDRAALAVPGCRTPLVAWLEDGTALKQGANVKYDIRAVKLALGARVRGISGDARLLRKLVDSDASGYLDDMMELVGMGGAKAEASKVQRAAVTKLVNGFGAEVMLAKRAEADAKAQAADLPPRKWPPLHAARQEGLEAVAALEAKDPALAAYARTHTDADSLASWAYAVTPPDVLHRYNARDSIGCDRVALWADERVGKNAGLVRIRKALVDRIPRALARVEEWGIGADVGAMHVFDTALKKDSDAARAIIDAHPHGGPQLNVRSGPQLRTLLFDKLKLAPIKKTDTDLDSTDDSVLQHYEDRDPLLKSIRVYRHVEHLRGAYGAGMSRFIRADGRIHPSVLPDGASSGRTSMQEPNLQQMPSEKRDPYYGKLARDCFVSGPGRVLVSLDYCLAGDTLLDTPRGDIAIEDIRVGDLVYSYNHASARPDCTKVVAKKHTGLQRTMVVVLDNGKRVRCTRNHRWLRVDGSEVHASSLQVGDRLLPLRRGRASGKGYETLYSRSNREYVYARKAVAAAKVGIDLGKLYDVVHHVDENCLNNDPSNLAIMSARDHKVLHGREHAAKQWSDPIVRERMALGISKACADRGGHGGDKNPNFGNRKGKALKCVACNRGFYKPPSMRAKYCSKECYHAARRKEADLNHTVAEIVDDGLIVPTYDIETARDHNFALSAGVFVHNSQIEIRVAAMISRDAAMIEAFLSGEDFHLRTAKLISKLAWGISPDAVTATHRAVAKNVNFAVLYGAGAGRVAAMIREQGLPCTKAEAQRAMDLIAGQFKHFAAWRDARIEEVKRIALSRTVWAGQPARQRALYKAGDPDEYVRQNAINGAVNTPVQGTASDFLMASLCEVVDWIENDGLENDVVLCLPVHDQLLFDCTEAMADEVIGVGREIMTGWPSAGADVPLIVDADVGTAWGSLVKESKWRQDRTA